MLSRFGRHRHLSLRVLNEYLDNLLPEPARQRAGSELAACGVCRQELESLTAAVSLLRQTRQDAPRRSFTWAAPPPAPAPAPPLLRLPVWAYAGAASVAGLALAVLVSADLLGVAGTMVRDRESDTSIMAAPAPLGMTAEGTPLPESAQARTMKSAEVQRPSGAGSPETTPPPAGQAGPAAPAGASPAAPEAARNLDGGAAGGGQQATAEPPASGPATELASGYQSEGLVVRKTSEFYPVPPTPWYWRALEGLAAAASLGFLLALLLRWRRARR